MSQQRIEQMQSALEAAIAQHSAVVVGYSAGVDSSVVMAAAHRALGVRALAVTAATETITEEDLELAASIAREHGWRHTVIRYDELAIPGYAANPTDRCYHCKDALYTRLVAIAGGTGAVVLDGANLDDVGDYRPGRRAAREQAVFSPLIEVGATKEDVRALALLYGLPNHGKPAAPCLSSRVPYGTPITRELLHQIDAAERALRMLGFQTLRVRHHGDVARLELPREEFARALELSSRIDEALREAGYRYVALDLRGFRSGALNEALPVQITLPLQ